jgi:uncharacterized protein YbaR (Trm112 family)/ubiquinone/menaquinone biosynthesis C-methylase UbiE
VRESFLELVRCPECRAPLDPRDLWQIEGDELLEGGLACPCGQRYPVIDGVARLLPASGALSVERRHPAFFAEHPEYRRASGVSHSPAQPPPQRERAWEAAATQLREASGRAGWILDVGDGRMAEICARAGADAVALALGDAVEAAVTRARKDFAVVEGDLRMPPFADEAFDLVTGLGALPHTPRPREALRRLVTLVKPGGWLQADLCKSYRDEGGVKRAAVRALEAARVVTTRVPGRWLTMAPRRLHDLLALPVEHRGTRDDLRRWLAQAGLEEVRVDDLGDWVACGRRPAARAAEPAPPPEVRGRRLAIVS